MCHVVPAEVVTILLDELLVVDIAGVRKTVNGALLEDVAAGDFVLVHVGFALRALNQTEAEETLRLMAECFWDDPEEEATALCPNVPVQSGEYSVTLH